MSALRESEAFKTLESHRKDIGDLHLRDLFAEDPSRGTDLVAAVVETHGRKKTAELIEGIEVIAPRYIEYRGGRFPELDVPAVLSEYRRATEEFEQVKQLCATLPPVVGSVQVGGVNRPGNAMSDVERHTAASMGLTDEQFIAARASIRAADNT